MLSALHQPRLTARPTAIIPPSGFVSYRDRPLTRIPLLLSKIAAGFPSPADDYVQAALSPTEYLVSNKSTTFFMSMQGDSLLDIGILHGDILVIDRTHPPHPGDIVVALVENEFLIRILGRNSSNTLCLLAANHRDLPMPTSGKDDWEIWGKVTGIMRKFK